MPYPIQSYDDSLREILKKGIKKGDRTGIGTLSIPGMQNKYDLTESYPLLTKRKVWPKAVIAELLWFISGSTNNNDLVKLGCKFWTPWVDKEFEEKHGYVDGSFGPVYGFQLRYKGGLYLNGDAHKTNDVCYNGYGVFNGTPEHGCGGVDQLQNMIDTLKSNPTCRRNMFDLWSPTETHLMKLPPCHFNFQVLVYGTKLCGILTQRSCDFPVGVPANIQFYSTLLIMLGQQTGLEPWQLIHNTNDSHIYLNQIDAVEEYLERPESPCPTIQINVAKDIDSYTPEDFTILDYNPESMIPMEVAV